MLALPPADRSQSRGGGAGAGASVSTSASVSAATSAPVGVVGSGPGTQALTLPVLPFFVMGESMGGAVAILAAHTRAFPFDGVVLRAPMCGIDEGLVPPSCVVAVLDRMGRCCPAAPIVPGCVWGVSS
jgi:alpha-beta hydrolase superfamily lysophospholipase